MSNQNIPSDLVVDLSVEEQQLLSGGYYRGGHHRGGYYRGGHHRGGYYRGGHHRGGHHRGGYDGDGDRDGY